MNEIVVVERVTSRAELEQAWEVRLEVFVSEQGVPLAEEVDDADTAATTAHVLARSGDAVVGGREVRRGLAHASQPSRRQTSAQPAKIFALYSTPSWLGLANRTQSAAATASSAASFSATSSADPA